MQSTQLIASSTKHLSSGAHRHGVGSMPPWLMLKTRWHCLDALAERAVPLSCSNRVSPSHLASGAEIIKTALQQLRTDSSAPPLSVISICRLALHFSSPLQVGGKEILRSSAVSVCRHLSWWAQLYKSSQLWEPQCFYSHDKAFGSKCVSGIFKVEIFLSIWGIAWCRLTRKWEVSSIKKEKKNPGL